MASYTVSTHGVSTYFLPMVADRERERTIAEAISAMMQSLKNNTEPGKPLRVLDFGCGTGILGRWVLKTAKRLEMNVTVIFLDMNKDMINEAKANLDEDDRDRAVFIVGTTSNRRGGLVHFKEEVDAMVSEMLGTFSVSESMPKYLGQALPLCKWHNGIKHVIPQQVTQFADLYPVQIFMHDDDRLYSDADYVNILRNTTPPLTIKYLTVAPPINKTIDRIGRVAIRTDSFNSDNATYSGQAITSLPVTGITADHFLAFAWNAQLWDNIYLESSLRTTNPARMQAWEVPVVFLIWWEGSFTGEVRITWRERDITPQKVTLYTENDRDRKLLRQKQREQHMQQYNMVPEPLCDDWDDDPNDKNWEPEGSKQKSTNKKRKAAQEANEARE